MEAFEQFVAIALESEGFVVSPAVKFPVQMQTHKTAYAHGYEVDLVAARSDRLILATVKSFFGSRGVVADHVLGTTKDEWARRLYLLLNEPLVRTGVVAAAAERYGYQSTQVQLRLYVGRFAGPSKGLHEAKIRAWCAGQSVGAGCIEVVGVAQVVDSVRAAAAHHQYRDNPVLVTLKVLQAPGLLSLDVALGDDTGDGGPFAAYPAQPPALGEG